jgi:hypothetical protein
MQKRSQAAGVAIVLIVVALLACSPQVVLQEIIGAKETEPPTRVAQAVAVITPTTVTPVAVAVAAPSMTAPAPAPTAPAAPAPAEPSPGAPSVLPVRTDLAPLALRDWPRPANDNGRCIHFLPTGYFSERDFEIQIPRLKGLQIRWVLALYSDEKQLRLAATQFKAAGVVPVWRRMIRAYQRYYSWDRDIQILNEVGLPPYFQLYNEPDNGAEWDGRDVNRDQWVSYAAQAAKDIYNAGGYVGFQVLDPDWLRAVIQEIKVRKGERIFGRMFFVPHPYGANHPPNWTKDEIGVLGFRYFADVFQQELGYVPPFIAGEGGWQYKNTEDNTFPIIDDKLHAQYHVELFRWFLDGKLSDGKPLPDYLFAFCPWILAGQMEGSAWYDSFEGNRELTIAEIKKLPPAAVRKFTWDKK